LFDDTDSVEVVKVSEVAPLPPVTEDQLTPSDEASHCFWRVKPEGFATFEEKVAFCCEVDTGIVGADSDVFGNKYLIAITPDPPRPEVPVAAPPPPLPVDAVPATPFPVTPAPAPPKLAEPPGPPLDLSPFL
jgi:hypothetical protein